LIVKAGTWVSLVYFLVAFAIPAVLFGCNAEEPAAQSDEKPSNISRTDLSALRAKHAALKRKLALQTPSGPYIVVDTARNRLYVKRGQDTVLTAIASTGSGTILDKPNQPGSQWIFDTPRGEFTVQSRLTNPVWVKPDWAFIEEGQRVPVNRADRLESGILGEYALGFGKGYFIHGTLYPRLLGKNVTHGCIRLNDDDLRSVYKLAKIGTPILIF
jgi:L,D-transpeptidase YbiS